MDTKVHEFLTHHRVGVISVLDLKGNPHSAAVHYAHSENPFCIFIVTEKKSRKMESLVEGLSSSASFVTGFSEEEWITFQADGDIHIPRGDTELNNAKAAYYVKFPNAQANEHNSDVTFLTFTPHWWKYTNLNPEPWETISSQSLAE